VIAFGRIEGERVVKVVEEPVIVGVLRGHRTPFAEFVLRVIIGADEPTVGGLGQDFVRGRDGCGGFLAGDGLLAEVVLDQLAKCGGVFGAFGAGRFFGGLHCNFAADAGDEEVIFSGARIAFSDVFPESSDLHDQRFYLAAKYQNVVGIEVQALVFFRVAVDERLGQEASFDGSSRKSSHLGL